MANRSWRLIFHLTIVVILFYCMKKVDGLPPGVKKHTDSTEPVPDSDKDPDVPVSAQAAGGGDKANDNAAKQDGNAASGDEAGGACGGRDEPEAHAANPLDSPWVRHGQERQRRHHFLNQTRQPNQDTQVVQELPPEVNPHTNSTLLVVADTGQVPDASQAEQTGHVSTLGTPDDNTSEGTQSGGACGGAHVDGVSPLDPPWPRHANAESSGAAVVEAEAETTIPVGATAATLPQVATQHRPVHHQPDYARALGLHVRGTVWVTPDTNVSDDDTGTGHDLTDNIHMRPGYQLHNPNLTDTNLDDIDLARQHARRAGQSGSLLVLVFTCVVLVLNGRPVRGRAAVRGPLLQHSHNGHHIELPPSWLLVSLLLAVILFLNLVM
ncbi:uncharacterized protein [Littorina saxatilis]|uniref:Uncharacterized protein n=1 Tax=Littorina saxatilis TaxID=31220 RepID=A0AAN9BMT5_9CAEN